VSTSRTGEQPAAARLDPTLSSPVRLRIAAYLAGCEEADFAAVQAYCEMSASSLSKQVTTLLSAGHVVIHKVASGRYTKTRLALTAEGREALSAHVAWLRQIAGEVAPA
jgi:hypothetical protein